MNFTVYKSSAGSGKTTTLVKEYLCLAIPKPNDFGGIVGITFTVKATNEMKSRVMVTLGEIIEGNHDFGTIGNLAFAELQKKGMSEEEFTGNAYVLLKNILHYYSSFAFSTIDSFVLRIVKAFAFDLRLPLNFDVELDNDLLIDEAVSALISRAGYEEQLTDYLIKYIEFQADEERETRAHNLIAKFAKILFNDSYSDFRNALGKMKSDELYSFSENVKKRTDILRSRIIALGKSAVELIESRELEDKDFYYSGSGIWKYFRYIKNHRTDKFAPGKRVLSTIEEDNWYGSQSKNNPARAEKVDEIKEELTAIFNEIQELYPEYIAIYALRRKVESVVLLGEVNNELNNYYRENSVIHLSETIKKVAALVETEEMPFIYERIGEKYNHYLIDEFQDTSVSQWNNLVPLVENSLSEGYFNLIVGDAKQSIYRWRGGDFRQFVNLPLLNNKSELQKAREAVLKRNYREIVLDNNYRSSKNVVEFNNELFEFYKNKSNEIIKDVFENHRQNVIKNDEGYVEVSFVPYRKEDDSVFNEKIVSIVKEEIQRGRKYNDITFLARKNKDLSYIAEVLVQANIPIISSDSLFLSASRHILFIINFLRWMKNQDDSVSSAAVFLYLEKEGYSVSEKDIYASATEFISAVYPDSEIAGVIYSDDVTILAEALAKTFGFYEKSYAYVIHFLSFVRKSESATGFGIESFLEYAERYFEKENISIPEGIDAVNLMTIHKAKGLEFPVVVFADVYSKKQNNDFLALKLDKLGIKKPEYGLVADNKELKDSLFADDKNLSVMLDETDSINVLYVATTRASHELFVISEEKGAYNKLFKDFTAQADFLTGDDDKTIFYSGSREDLKRKSEDIQAEVLNNAHFRNWYSRKKLKLPVIINDKEILEKIESGNIVHELLSEIKEANDVDLVVNNNIATGIIDSSDGEKYRLIMREIVSHPQISPYFKSGKKILNERSLLTPSGKLLRPDRIVIEDNTVTVIDYKYAGYNTTPESQLQKYIAQVSEYKKLVSEVFSGKNISGKILWLKDEIFVQDV